MLRKESFRIILITAIGIAFVIIGILLTIMLFTKQPSIKDA